MDDWEGRSYWWMPEKVVLLVDAEMGLANTSHQNKLDDNGNSKLLF